MRRFATIPLAAALWAACATSAAAPADAARLEPRSRSLVEGPARVAAVAGGTIVLGTGCSVAVFGGGKLDAPGILQLEGEVVDLAIRGSIACVASLGEGLVTVDVADPARPRRLGLVEMAQPGRCAVAGGALFVADGRGRLSAFSLDDPRSPRAVESLSFTAVPASLCGEGDVLAVVFPERTELRRVAPGGATRRVAGIASKSPVTKGALVGGVLCLLSLDGTVACWDVARPETPRAMPPIDRPGVGDVAGCDGEGALLGAGRYLVPFRVERAGASSGGAARIRLGKAAALPAAGAGAAGDDAASGGNVSAVFVGGGFVGTLAPFDGARLYERRRGSLRETGFFPTRGFALGVVASRGLVYLANGRDGVRIGAVSAAGAVEWIGHVRTGEARDVKLSGTHLVVADGSNGLKIADVSDPRAPRLVASLASPNFLCALAIVGGRVYCAGGMGGAEIVDIADPRRPRLVWRRGFSEVRGIDADASRMYLCDGDRGLRIFALGGREPREISTLDTPGWNCGVVAAGALACLADGGKGIVVADVSDPARPRALGSADVGSIVRHVFLSGDTLFAAAYTRGIAAIDVSNPARPAVTAAYRAVNDGRSVFADERFVYLASGSGGLYVLSYER